MNEITMSNLENRLNQIMARLGALAYERREHTLRMEVIDAEVAQMEAQRVLIEATRNDLIIDQKNEEGRLEKEREDEREKRSARAKAAAEKKKREKAEKTPRKGKGTTSA